MCENIGILKSIIPLKLLTSTEKLSVVLIASFESSTESIIFEVDIFLFFAPQEHKIIKHVNFVNIHISIFKNNTFNINRRFDDIS